MASPSGGGDGGGGGGGGPAPTPNPPLLSGRKRLGREELADIEYLFDKLAGGENGAGAPATTANSPLPLPIVPAAPLPPPPPSSADPNAASAPTIGFAQLKFALRAFGLPVRKDDVVFLLRRHGHLEPDTSNAAAGGDGRGGNRAPPPRLSRGAFRELVGQALRERVPGGRDADMARAFGLLDRGGKGRVTRDDLAAAAVAALGAGGAAALGGADALADMVALFGGDGGRAGRMGEGEEQGGGVTLVEFAAGMSAVARADRASVGGGEGEGGGGRS